MRSGTKKIVMLFMAFAILLLPVRYALATSYMAQHNNNMEATQTQTQTQNSINFSLYANYGNLDTNNLPHHANHADMDMDAVVVKEEKQQGACSCDVACSGGCSGCPHINLGMVSVFTSSGEPERGTWFFANEDSIGIATHVEISPPNPSSV